MKLVIAMLGLSILLVVGGCVGDRDSSDLSASTSTRHARDDDSDTAKPRQVCEHTEIGGEAKTFCY